MSSSVLSSGRPVSGPEAWVLGAVGFNLLASVGHGVAHGVAVVPVPWWTLAAVLCGVFVGPLVGVWLLFRERYWVGAWLVLVATLVGAVGETLAHFVVQNPDHVSAVAHAGFAPTAALSTAGTVLAAVAAAWYVDRYSHSRSASSSMDSST